MARCLLIFFATLLAVPATAWADPVPDSLQEAWRDGTEAYRQGRYARAAAAYESIAAAGFESGTLFYNLGNTHYRLGQMGRAIRYYEKARSRMPSDARVAHNLNMARSRADASAQGRTRGGLARAVQGWPTKSLFLGGVALWTAGLLFWGWRRRAERGSAGRKRASGALTTAALTIAVLGGATAVLALGVDYVQSLDRRAVVLVDRVPVHAEPGIATGTPLARTDTTAVIAGSQADTVLVEGTIVLLQSEQDGWSRIEDPVGRVGWVPSPALGDI